MKNEKPYENCKICPRQCGADRTRGETGYCGVTERLRVSRAALHFWEEPCISGEKGSGTVFFCGCSLKCVYCQNREIAGGGLGKEISVERLSEIFLELQEKGANNINLVTAGHYLFSVCTALERARRQGLYLPVVYNTGSYETVEALKRLDGLVDVYLADFKYMDPAAAERYSHAKDYPKTAKAAVAEMVRQKPKPSFVWEQSKNSEQYAKHRQRTDAYEDGMLMESGVIVRQLLLPGQLADAKKIIRYLYETYQNRIYLSMMSQYTPMACGKQYPELDCTVRAEAYDRLVEHALSLGVECGFFQEGGAAKESFIPYFDNEGV